MPDLKKFSSGLRFGGIAATYALGALGGGLALAAGMPLGMLFGSLLVTALAAGFGLRLFGHPVAVPQKWRFVLVPVIGVAIGAHFPPDFLDHAARWWISLAGLVLFVPLAHALSFLLYRRLGRIDGRTAFFAAMPGGFIEALDLGEKAGAAMPMLIMLQFLRLFLCILFIPLGFALFSGQAVGSSSGLAMAGGEGQMDARDGSILLACAVLGWWGAARLRLPAAVLAGPLALSAIAHVAGLTEAAPPGWMVVLTQGVLGTALGARFSGFDRRQLLQALWLSAISVAALLGLAGIFAMLLAVPTGEPAPAVLLAFAPGGISEMSLVALSLQLAVVYVTLHHLARIVLAVIVARIGLALMPRLATEPKPQY
ncbi:MAG: AbrB family transcriptional regulator [Pararhodobacter sp.]|nr:AbrB family transcriptional regulator [Pararhodobacter sp.]